MGFIKSVSDQEVYTLSNKEQRLLVGVYVDDRFITGSNTEEIEGYKSSMKTKFEMTDFGFLNSFLIIKVIQGKTEIKICQKNYALKFLNEFNMKECNSSKTSMECRLKLNGEGGVEVEPTPFIKLIRYLRYLTLT